MDSFKKGGITTPLSEPRALFEKFEKYFDRENTKTELTVQLNSFYKEFNGNLNQDLPKLDEKHQIKFTFLIFILLVANFLL